MIVLDEEVKLKRCPLGALVLYKGKIKVITTKHREKHTCPITGEFKREVFHVCFNNNTSNSVNGNNKCYTLVNSTEV